MRREALLGLGEFVWIFPPASLRAAAVQVWGPPRLTSQGSGIPEEAQEEPGSLHVPRQETPTRPREGSQL